MTDQPLYPKVVAGYEENERGEDALVLARRVVERDGGELNVVHVEKGSPADTFQALAERGEADLVALGSTHHAHVGSVAPGSVAEHLLHGARCRLVIAPKGYAHGDHSQDRLRVVGVGYDGMAESHAALDEAAKLATKFGASMKVIGVLAPDPAHGPPPPRPRREPTWDRIFRAVSTTPCPSCPQSCAPCRCWRGGTRFRSCSRLPRLGSNSWCSVRAASAQ